MRGWFFTTIYKTIYTHKNILKIIFVSLFLTNCNYKNLKIDPNGSDGSNTNFSADTVIDDQFVMRFSLVSCQQCHAGARAPTLDTVDKVKANITKVLSEIASGDMPTADAIIQLKDCEKAVVKAWAEGTPKTFGEVTECKSMAQPALPPPIVLTPIELMPLNFKTLKERILAPKCTECHSVLNSNVDEFDASLIPFDNYSDIASGDNSKYWAAPGAESKVNKEVTYNHDTEDDGMPPKRSKAARLTLQEMDFIVRWIDAGKPE